MPVPKTVVISCAGVGSRLGVGMPKALVEIQGEPILLHHLKNLDHVKDVRIVVGYEKTKVIKTALNYRKDITFVFNHDYRTTNTLESLRLGAKFANDLILSIDGDLLVAPEDIHAFLNTDKETLGYATAYSDEAVFCNLDTTHATPMVTHFTRDKLAHEWTGLALIKRRHFDTTELPDSFFRTGHIYHFLEHKLPINAKPINCCEIDTPNDLIRAQIWAKNNLKGNKKK